MLSRWTKNVQFKLKTPHICAHGSRMADMFAPADAKINISIRFELILAPLGREVGIKLMVDSICELHQPKIGYFVT